MASQDMLFMRNGCEEENSSDQEDVWDDTALIKAYDVAVKTVKDQIAQRLECSDLDARDVNNVKRMTKKNGSKNKKMEWRVGEACRAVYSEDGKIYEATIQSIKSHSNSCIVKYIGYENEEEVPIAQLMVSLGPDARALQEKESSYDNNEGDMETSNLLRGVRLSKPLGKENFVQNNLDPKNPFTKEYITNFGSQFPPLHQTSPFGYPSSSNMATPHMIPSSLPPPPPLSVTSSLPLGDSEALSAMLMSWYMSGFHTGYYQGLQQAKHMNGLTKQAP